MPLMGNPKRLHSSYINLKWIVVVIVDNKHNVPNSYSIKIDDNLK